MDYCVDVSVFLDRYAVFEDLITGAYPDIVIALENRSGSQYKKSNFLISNSSNIAGLLQNIKERDLQLKIMLDIPQMFTGQAKASRLDLGSIEAAFSEFAKDKNMIVGIHIWGNNGNAHMGDLNGLFNKHNLPKAEFMDFVARYFNDGKLRYLVPEVNSSQKDFDSIITDITAKFDLATT
jgi:hypothetical protein